MQITSLIIIECSETGLINTRHKILQWNSNCASQNTIIKRSNIRFKLHWESLVGMEAVQRHTQYKKLKHLHPMKYFKNH